MSKYRVFVVDDDPDIRFVISGLLGGDFEIVQAENGLDCLEKIERYEPDLVLMDIRMPVMDGFAACAGIRRHDDFAKMPVFFLTGAGSEGARAQAAEAGSHGFVEKPFETEALVGAIRNFFATHRQPPRLKTFTIRELKKIDETPLRRADVEAAAAAELVPPPSAVLDTLPDADQPARKRRVFGAVRRKDEPPPVPPPSAMESGDSFRTVKIRDLKPPSPPAPPPAELPPIPEQPVTPVHVSPREIARAQATPPSPSTTRPMPPPAPPPAAPPDNAPPRRLNFPTHPPVTPPAPPPRPVAPTPSAPEPVARPSRPIPAEVAKGRSAGKSERPRVLCMIDRREELSEYASALRGQAEFLPLEDAVEAVEIIAKFQPDVVFARIQGTDYNGLQLAQLLKSNPRLSHIQIVFVNSGAETPAIMTSARRLTSNETMRAPIEADRIRASLAAVTATAGFAVRDKKHPYGTYVKEVLQKARQQNDVQRAVMEKEAYQRKAGHLAAFMANELKDYSAPEVKNDLEARRNRAQNYYVG